MLAIVATGSVIFSPALRERLRFRFTSVSERNELSLAYEAIGSIHTTRVEGSKLHSSANQ